MVPGYKPDALFLDIGMPGLEKTAMANLTGWGQPEDRRRTAEGGFDHHFDKPTELKALEKLLAGL